jgi:plastin-1
MMMMMMMMMINNNDNNNYNTIDDIDDNVYVCVVSLSQVAASGKSSTMRNFKDTSLKSGTFFLDLVNAIEPRAVNWELVTSGSNDDERMSNAKYSISIARKVNAQSLDLWHQQFHNYSRPFSHIPMHCSFCSCC